MRRLWRQAALALLLAGCAAQAARSPSPLERFDALRGTLGQVNALSGAVAADMTRLNARMRTDDVSGVKRAAVTLKRDAAGLQSRAGRVRASVQRLIPGEQDGHVRAYFRLVAGGLATQEAEGRQLVRLSNLLWHDPLLLDPRNERRMWRIAGQARAYAVSAVRAAQRSAALRQRYRRAFRYVPSKQRH